MLLRVLLPHFLKAGTYDFPGDFSENRSCSSPFLHRKRYSVVSQRSYTSEEALCQVVGCLPYGSRWPQFSFALLSPIKQAKHSALSRRISLELNRTEGAQRGSTGLCFSTARRELRQSVRNGSGVFVSEQAERACPHPRLCAIVHPQFAENMAHMAFDGLDGDH